MADWRQIQARIRKAKASSDPPAQLAELYERTRDAMVAFELAVWHEKAGNAAETVQWYTTAAQRFRRAQWRTKAEEALTRLGAPIPEAVPAAAPERAELVRSAAAESPQAAPGLPYMTSTEAERVSLHAGDEMEPSPTEAQEPAEEGAAPAAPVSPAGGVASQKRRRRGRRGGRKRRGRGGADQAAPTGAAPRMSRPAGPAAATSSAAGRFHPVPARPFSPGSSGAGAGLGAGEAPLEVQGRQGRLETELEPPPVRERGYEPPAAPAWSGAAGLTAGGPASLASSRSRAGDPGLSSRIAQLESQMRRLLACPLASLEDAEQAPAGPGVLLLSDSDQVTHYYIEACQTLRIGIGNLLRGGRGSKGASHLKPSLAEHLGISDSRVAKYLKDHCAVRWIQLDEGAAELAHFAMAVLRPVVTE
jgi:hypothetical protein